MEQKNEKWFENIEEWYDRKAKVADAFSALHFADSIELSDEEIKNLSFCLFLLNEYLDKTKPLN